MELLNRCLPFIFLVVACLHNSEGFDFSIPQSFGTWEQGQQACQAVQGSLAVLNTEELQTDFYRRANFPIAEKLWMGQYLGYTKMVWIQGCYNFTALPANRRTIPITDNFLVTCLHECNGSAYVAMQGNQCHCFNTLPRLDGMLPGGLCRNRCPGEAVAFPQAPGFFMSECGSNDPRFNAVSVYRLARPNETRMDPNAVNLGECIAFNAWTKTWLPRVCTMQDLFTCDRPKCNGGPQQCMVESQARQNWYLARSMCEDINTHMSVTNTTSMTFFNNKPLVGDLFYWTGLHRKEHRPWVTEKEHGGIEPSGRCMAIMRNRFGQWGWSIEDCAQRLRYVCLTDYLTTTSTASTSTTPTTTTTRTTRRTTRWNPWVTTTQSTGFPTFNPDPQPVNVTTPAGASSLFHIYSACSTIIVAIVFSIVLI